MACVVGNGQSTTMEVNAKSMAKVAREVLSLPEFNEAREDELFRGFFGAPIGVRDCNALEPTNETDSD